MSIRNRSACRIAYLAFAVYALGAFVSLEPSFVQWSTSGRIAAVCFFVMAVCLVIPIMAMIDEG